ncbi:MAG TPA: TIGR02530 family flagellar biosynthesis protein [Solirubrobacteraceae bacterium]|nr:TIGR02530 family flagellar biosynthesis protein [Solirubrobacteraceae bacterium]
MSDPRLQQLSSPAPLVAPPSPAPTRPARATSSGPAPAPFARALAEAGSAGQTQPLRFSKHALARVARRNIPLDQRTLARLAAGVGRAAGKGARDSVVLVDGTAFVVSVANRTVLTAVIPEQTREQVFTNIDSAVIA